MAKITKKNPNMKKLILLVTIMPLNKNAIIIDLMEKYGVNYHLSFIGEGGATNEMLKMLGLTDSKRIITLSFIREDKAKECFDKSEKLFKDDKENIKRVYSNLMLYAITAGKEKEFLEYLYKYITEKEESFDNIDSLIKELVSYIDKNNQSDKSDKYLIIRLLRYCKNFYTEEYSKKIANILIEKSSNFYDDKKRKESTEDVDIEKDYCFVYYQIKKEKISLSNSYIFVENLKGYFQYMRKLSLYLTEILTGDESYFDKSVAILKEMLELPNTDYEKAFGKFFEESAESNLDKYKWAYNLSKKLYM